MANLIDKCCGVLTAPPTGCSPLSLCGPPYSPKHNNIEIWPINNSALASKCSSERNCMSLTLHQKVEMIKVF